MLKRSVGKICAGWMAVAAIVQPALLVANGVEAAPRPPIATPGGLTTVQKIALLRRHVKYVFVIFHENESFDHYFGTFPGANGLFSAPRGTPPANRTVGFVQNYLDTKLTTQTISSFLMPQAVQIGGYASGGAIVPIYPADYVSVDHSHQGMVNAMHLVNGIAQNDRYAMDQEGLTTDATGQLVTGAGAAPSAVSLAAKQKAQADLSHIDCDTIPFMWWWAKNFVLFDNFRQTIVGPSTPNAIAIIAGQAGETQWALHPGEGAKVRYANPAFANVRGASYSSGTETNTNAFVPVVADPGPFPGSKLDPSTAKPPYNFDENAGNPSLDLTFATLPLSFMGSNIRGIIKNDQNPAADLLDVQGDIKTIADFNAPVNWGWFQQGFNANDTSDPYTTQNSATPNPTGNPGLNTSYVLHHNGPQYFGYLADNTQVLRSNLHGAKDFFTVVNSRALPSSGGVFYLRGGFNNNDGLVPLNPTPGIQHAFLGNDDHPAYSDQQITEAFTAKAVNAIANSPYWAESAIIITYDETDGFYDHVPARQRSTFADGSILAAGPRVPTIVISPWAAAGTISHRYSEHSSIIKLIDALFKLVPLARLPDEIKGRAAGLAKLGQANLGPADDPRNDIGNMLEAFDYKRMLTNRSLPRSLATFGNAQIAQFPHLATPNYSPNGYTNGACAAIGILPTDFASQAAYKAGTPSDPYPIDVNPRPTQSPGTPTSGNWTS